MAARKGEERAPGADEETTKATGSRDPRAEALKALQAQADTRREAENPAPAFEGDPVDAGGTVKVGVLFDRYQLRVDDVWRTFEKGAVLKVSEEVADRGESIEGLKRL